MPNLSLNPGRLAGGAYAPSARGRLAGFVTCLTAHLVSVTRHSSVGEHVKTSLPTLTAILTLFIGHAFAGVDEHVKATFDRFVAAQNAHDVPAVRDVLLDSPNFLWVTRGLPVWGRDAALKRFETLYQGTWKLSPDTANLKVVLVTDTTAQLFVPIGAARNHRIGKRS